jgi:hypothetical protein
LPTGARSRPISSPAPTAFIPSCDKACNDWRGHRYFVVGDEMIIVDRNNRIVAVIAL